MAARTDNELQERLLSVAKRHRELALEAARKYFPVFSEQQSRSLIELIHASFLGMRSMSSVADPESIEIVLAALEDSAATQLARQVSPE